MNNSIVYAQSKATNFKKVWTKVRANHAQSTFTFNNYNFKIDGVVYKTPTPDWKEKIEKLIMWENLGR